MIKLLLNGVYAILMLQVVPTVTPATQSRHGLGRYSQHSQSRHTPCHCCCASHADAAGDSRSDTSNASMDSTDTATMRNHEAGPLAGTHSNPLPSTVLSQPAWHLPPPQAPQAGQISLHIHVHRWVHLQLHVTYV